MARKSNSSSKKANAQRPQPPNSKSVKRRPVNFARAGILALAAACTAAAVGAGPQAARAIVTATPAPRDAEPTSTPTGTPNSTTLPLNSSLFFVLDDRIGSRASKSGSVARAHLRDPIVLAGRTVAPAGTPVEIRVVQVQGAQMGNVDGSVEIYFEPIRLADGKTLPLMTPTGHIDPHVSAGKASTQGVVDTVEDIFVPYHYLYHVLRKGMEVDLPPGTVVRARTGATLNVTPGGVAVATPQPFISNFDTPHPAFQPAALATPPGFHMPTPKPTPSPTAQPT